MDIRRDIKDAHDAISAVREAIEELSYDNVADLVRAAEGLINEVEGYALDSLQKISERVHVDDKTIGAYDV